MRAPRKSTSKSHSKTKQIVLVSQRSTRAHPLPLCAYDPRLESRNASPRPTKKPLLVDPSSLRKSPWLAPSFDVAKSPVRRSPRIGPSQGEAKSRDSTPRMSGARGLVGPSSARRSPRLDSSSEEVNVSDSTPRLSLRKSPRFAASSDEVHLSLRKSPRLGPRTEEVNLKNFASPIAPRRSPRTGPGLDEAKPNDSSSKRSKTLYLTYPNSLRSPRSASSLSEAKPSDSTPKTSRTQAPVDQTSRRSSPRFGPSPCDSVRRSPRITEPVKCTKLDSSKNSRESGKAMIPDEKSTRRSSRFSPAANGGEKSTDSAHKSRKRTFSELDSSKPSAEENGGTPNKRAPKLRPKVEDNINDVISTMITEVADGIDENTELKSSDDLDECPSKSVSSSSKNEELMSSMEDQEESDLINGPEPHDQQPPKKIEATIFATYKGEGKPGSCFFIGDPIPADEAQERWRWRYELRDQISKGQLKKPDDDDEDEVFYDVACHFAQASISNCIFSLGDCAYIKGDGNKKHVGRIVEFFKATNEQKYFRVQWFYAVEDTVINGEGAFHDKRRLFYSTIMNDNPIDCIISKVHITKITPRVGQRIGSISPSNFYYDMEYCVDYSTFRSLDTDTKNLGSTNGTTEFREIATKVHEPELALLDLYSGCGGMSTGLTLGTKLAGVDLVTRWSLDCNESACDSLKLNHPETNVRNEAAEDFLDLLKEWEKLCKLYRFTNNGRSKRSEEATDDSSEEDPSDNDDSDDDDFGPNKTKKHDLYSDDKDFEVSTLVDICYGDPNKTKKRGLYYKVNWKGYDSSEDTWEPVEGLSNCKDKIEEFVQNGMKKKILPLPTDVDIICGGPPCQGISGYNRYRNVESPLDDERNRQIIVFMDIVDFLKPSFVLMENVVDILKFDKGSLGRYALSRLVHMRYQARLGIIASGCYGLPQFRLRVFLWGALPHEILPQFPLPTHDVVMRYWPPLEFERNTVAYDESQSHDVEEALLLKDAISDLPPVTNDETREEMPYTNPPETEFQRYIRSTKSETVNGVEDTQCTTLYDHRAVRQYEDDYIRICKVPKRKGANFRDLPGVIVGRDNVARRDPDCEDILLPSGRHLVPNYAFTFELGRSKKPFSRLWWDETVPTVLTVPTCHSQTALHPEQDRILTLREYARLQGFPDHFRFCGTLKERYCQVGNAVSVNVSRALGYSLGVAIKKLCSNEPLLTLPRKFSLSTYSQLTNPEPEPEPLKDGPELGCSPKDNNIPEAAIIEGPDC